MTPMLSQNLETAVGPAMTLLLVSLEGIGEEPVSVAPVGVVDLPPMFEHQQAEVAVLDDGVARPAADREERGAARQTHSAMHDDGIRLVALDHADVEEAGVLSIHGMMHDGAIAVAMILR